VTSDDCPAGCGLCELEMQLTYSAVRTLESPQPVLELPSSPGRRARRLRGVQLHSDVFINRNRQFFNREGRPLTHREVLERVSYKDIVSQLVELLQAIPDPSSSMFK